MLRNCPKCGKQPIESDHLVELDGGKTRKRFTMQCPDEHLIVTREKKKDISKAWNHAVTVNGV